ncbi:hypothetical protein CCACVL1_20068 [Corchorus capsularis]|uniref:Uncharacterized protein n=1 Tax=Corchorus capsularis TaxID=210143 RepID=A0A1R3HD14_COCAP|nr:hypothetical protein CCACVL1_20068 [Corchorus capsularis]
MAGRAQIKTSNSAMIAMIADEVANMIRFLVDSYNKPVPAMQSWKSLPAHDSVLSRVKYLFSAESVASGRR